MCGIIAQFSKQNRPPDKEMIRAMAKDIHHRGPDNEGFYFDDWFGLGFQRLAILDLSKAGHQPMLDESKRFVIMYNGELYNYKTLRDELKAKGYKFFSDSDTEVVLKSFMAWDPECVRRFQGMFACVIVDLQEDRVFVARDQLGIKPLYLYEDENTILFASEIKSFRHYTKFAVNEDALYEQFRFKYVAGRRTIFKNVERVEAGTYLEFDRKGTRKETKYYEVLDILLHSKNEEINFGHIENVLHNSIVSHTQSDVGYNVQLSGGLDSSYITAVLSKEYNQRLNTYSVELSGYQKDESQYQKIVADRYGTEHHGFAFNGKDFADVLPKATWHMDMPIIHTACPLLMLLCQHSRENSKVILTGEGADELFGGYSRYAITRAQRLAFQLRRLGISSNMIPAVGKLRVLKKVLSSEIGLDEQAILSEEITQNFFRDIPKDLSYRQAIADQFPDLLRKITAADQIIYLQSLLERQDKMAMAMSVETRVPYCMPALFDMVNSYRPENKITPHLKMILKELSEKYYDKDFVYRKKVGFALPIADWLRDPHALGRYVDLISDATFRRRGFYNSDAVSRALCEHLKGQKNHTSVLWSIMRFEMWYRIFIDKILTPYNG